MGKINAARTVQKLICENNLELIVFVGTCGAIDSSIDIGDVGVVVGAVDSELDVRSFDDTCQLGEQPFSKDRIYTSDHAIADLALSLGRQYPMKVFPAYMATQSKFLDSAAKTIGGGDLAASNPVSKGFNIIPI